MRRLARFSFRCLPFLLAAALAAPLGAAPPKPAPAPEHWVLVRSTLTYHATDALHPVNGVTHAARGAGNCANGECSFLAAAPVNSFASGDTNRDLHMLQSVQGGKYPLVSVQTTVPEAALRPGTLNADLRVTFAGKTKAYDNVPFQIAREGKALRLTGTIPATLSDFQITPPAFLFIKIENPIPVSVDMTWQLGK